LREQVSVRKALVKMRAQAVASVRELVRAHGTRLRLCGVEDVPKVFAEVKGALEQKVELLVRPLVASVIELNARILEQDVALAQLAMAEPLIARLSTTPGVGPVVASAFVSVIDDDKRFDDAGKVEAYLGLVPSEKTSGERRLGAITKQGNNYTRAMLVQAAWCVLRMRTGDPLSTWGQRVLRRRGKLVAAVAVARRLAGILWAMWRDGTVYDSAHVGRESAAGFQKQGEQSLAVAAHLRARAQSSDFVQQALRKAQLKTSATVRAQLRNQVVKPKP